MENLNQLISETVFLELKMLRCTKNCTSELASAYNEDVFQTIRGNQLKGWSYPMLESYRRDIDHALAECRNLYCERYAYLLMQLDPEKYQNLQDRLPKPVIEKRWLVDWICQARSSWWEALGCMRAEAQTLMWSLYQNADNMAPEVCLRSELMTYSVETLRLYAAYVEKLQKENRDIDQVILEQLLNDYGYSSLKDAVQKRAAGL